MWILSVSLSIHPAKFEETDENLPTIEMMQQLAQFGSSQPDYYSREEFQKMELYLLRFFGWSVSYPTSAHFADYYLLHGSKLGNEESNSSDKQRSSFDTAGIREDMEVYNTHFLEASLRGEALLSSVCHTPMPLYGIESNYHIFALLL